MIEALNRQFAISGKVQFSSGTGDITMLAINSNHSSARISLYGAQLLSFVPAGQQDIIWMSERTLFQKGKAIRGGIPLCFPWFGPHPSDKSKPQHGFARLQEWQVAEVTETADESISVTLALEQSEASLQLWPFSFKAAARFIIGKTLQVQLTVTNTSAQPFDYSDALHTYFNISNIDTLALEGLQDATYYDAFGTQLKTQHSALLYFNEETNRRYVNTSSTCIIHDKGFDRKISVGKSGSKVTVVWNPGEATTATMSDMAPDGFKTFVCAEPANAYEGVDIISLQPGESHTLSALIQLMD